MRLHRFFISEKIGDSKKITVNDKALAHQLRQVFRLGTGDPVVLFDGSGHDFTCSIVAMQKGLIEFVIHNSTPSRSMPKRDVWLCAAVIKKDKFEWIVEKATELGVTHIVPVVADRSEKKALNQERLEKIAIEASEQSGRGNVPSIHEVVSLKDILSVTDNTRPDLTIDQRAKLVAFHTEGKSVRADHKDNSPLVILIGPEGGWSPEEIKLFGEKGVSICGLGAQILRSETAAISALSLTIL